MTETLFADRAGQSLEDVDATSSDRALLHVLWVRREADFPAHELWAVLCARHPRDVRLALLHDIAAEGRDIAVWTPARLLWLLESAPAYEPWILALSLLAWNDWLGYELPRDDRDTVVEALRRLGLSPAHKSSEHELQTARAALVSFADEAQRALHDETLGDVALHAEPALRGGATPSQAIPYDAHRPFSVGQVVDHPSFGLGVVVAVRPGRVEVSFAGGRRALLGPR